MTRVIPHPVLGVVETRSSLSMMTGAFATPSRSTGPRSSRWATPTSVRATQAWPAVLARELGDTLYNMGLGATEPREGRRIRSRQWVILSDVAVQPIYRRIRFGEPVVIVSGLPRSGTSMMMQMLASGGMPIVSDYLRQADDSNPQGYYELESVKELEKGGDTSWLRAARGRVVKIIAYLLRYLPQDFNYRVVLMQRC